MVPWVVAVFLSLALVEASGAELRGRVVGVEDGDTITIVDGKKRRHRVRISAIDAPEKGQPFGAESRQHLANWLHGESVIVAWSKRDRHARTEGVVIAFGHDMGLEQIRAGMAWWYRAQAGEQSSEDRQLYEFAEADARRSKRGLWSEDNPVPPWEWRANSPNR
jgi:endonuclease YncB( thermonuclease family)